MAFDVPNPPFQYHPPVAPVVPEPDNTAAKIISAGTGSAVSAFVNMALGSQRAKLEQEQMLQRGDIAARQLNLDEQRLGQTYELTKKAQDIQNKNVLLDYDVGNRALDLKEQQNKLYGTAIGRNIAFARQTADMLDEAGQEADKLKLFDPKFQTEHPMEFAKNAYAYEQMYGSTTEPRLKSTIKGFIDKAEESKVKLRDPVTKDLTTYSWAQIARDISENGTKSHFIDALNNSGYFRNTESGGGWFSGPKTTTSAPTTELRAVLEDARAAKFEELKDIKPKIEPFGAKNATQAIAQGEPIDLGVQPPPTGTSTPAGKLNPGAVLPAPEQTPAEIEADYVKRKSADNPANAEKYKAIFLSKYPDKADLLQ